MGFMIKNLCAIQQSLSLFGRRFSAPQLIVFVQEVPVGQKIMALRAECVNKESKYFESLKLFVLKFRRNCLRHRVYVHAFTYFHKQSPSTGVAHIKRLITLYNNGF